jgi:hypothetical protein
MRILIKTALFIIIFFLGAMLVGGSKALGGGVLFQIIFGLGTFAALRAIVKYKPKSDETALDKS